MGLSAGDVRPGKCFTTSGPRPEVRRITTVIGDLVIYQSRGFKARKAAWSGKLELQLDAFLAELDREVGCDYAFSSNR